MKVTFTSEAESGLEQIADFIAQGSPLRAVTFIEELRQAAMALADMPQAFPLVPRFERRGIRRRVHRDYLIFYRVSEDRIEILQVLHGARDYEALMLADS